LPLHQEKTSWEPTIFPEEPFSHGITNAYTENINGRIQEMKAAAKGFRNFNNYRNAILFYCGKLDMRLNMDEHFYAKLSHNIL
jgi:hypothetical protein